MSSLVGRDANSSCMTAYPSTISSNSAFGAESKSCSLRENGDRLAYVLTVDKYAMSYAKCLEVGTVNPEPCRASCKS
jgi:hypothetical protein